MYSRPSVKDTHDFSLKQQLPSSRASALTIDTPPYVVHLEGHRAREQNMSLTGGVS